MTVERDRGRMGAGAVWVLYALAIPTGAVSSVIGVVLAYLLRGGAEDWVRTHYDAQVRGFWSILAVALGLVVLTFVLLFVAPFAALLVIVGWITGIVGFLLAAWFTVRAVLGLMKLWRGERA